MRAYSHSPSEESESSSPFAARATIHAAAVPPLMRAPICAPSPSDGNDPDPGRSEADAHDTSSVDPFAHVGFCPGIAEAPEVAPELSSSGQ